jgi:phosphoribosylformylglycinamidine synthase
VADAAPVLAAATAAGVPAARIGRSGGGDLVLAAASAISVARLRAVHESTLPALLEKVG